MKKMDFEIFVEMSVLMFLMSEKGVFKIMSFYRCCREINGSAYLVQNFVKL